MSQPDHIIVGSGINALVCAAMLGGKGADVLVLERNDRIGGCMRTDWYKRNGSEAEFLNANETGPHTPGPTAEAIQFLISKDIKGWGSETIGTDAGKAGGMEPPFPAHTLMHKANRYGLASLCNLDQLPPKGAILIAAPLKIEHGTGSPIRALALVAGK